jgi:hypothetical protein
MESLLRQLRDQGPLWWGLYKVVVGLSKLGFQDWEVLIGVGEGDIMDRNLIPVQRVLHAGLASVHLVLQLDN